MSNDIVKQLRVLDASNCMDSDHLYDGLLVDAADEIERLREERDKARRWVCHLLANPSIAECLAFPRSGTPRDFAAEQGWDCCKGDK